MASIKWNKLVVWLVETDGNYSNSLRSALTERGATVNEFTDCASVTDQLRQGGAPHLLVMNAGGYKFNDFVRVGTPLTLLMWIVLTAVLAFAYQL